MMPMKQPGTTSNPDRTPAESLDWATAATEARRQRDAAVKAAMAERKQQQRRQREAWSPTQEASRP